MAKAVKELAQVKNEPTHKAFTIERVENGWTFSTVTYKGDRILTVESTEPDVKALTVEKFKIAAFKYWSSIG